MNKNTPFLVLDEPFRHLDEERVPLASELLRTLSEELGIQILVVTHQDGLCTSAGKVYRVNKKGRVCRITEDKVPGMVQ